MLFYPSIPLHKICSFLLLMAGTLLFYSCKKGDTHIKPEIVLDGNYFAANSMDLSQVQMFTKNGEITNLNVIKTYLSLHPYKEYFFTDKQSIPFTSGGAEIDFRNNAFATTISTVNGRKDSLKFSISERTAFGFILRAIDTIKARYTINSPAEAILLNADKIKKFSNCSPFDVSSGYANSSLCTYREAKPFIIKDDKVYLSFLTCFLNMKTNGGTSVVYSFSTGVFNPDIVKQLSATDTLIIQNKALLFAKK